VIRLKDWTAIKECMTDAGCSAAAIERAESHCRSGRAEEIIRGQRACRCDALEELHEKQKRLDRLDMLIRDTENE